MIILGLLLVAAAAVIAVEMIVANDGQIAVHMWRWTFDVQAFWLAVTGAALIVACLLGLMLLQAGGRRARRLRRERRALAAESRDLAEENRRLSERADAAEPKRSAPAPAAGFQRPAQPAGVMAARTDYAAPVDGAATGERVEGRHLDR